MQMHKLKAVIERELSAEFIDGIFVTALEGGCNYWCSEAAPVYSPPKEGQERFIIESTFTPEDNEENVKQVTAKNMVQAIEKVISGEFACRSDIRESITLAVVDNDCGNIDAEGADIIVQFAAFQELVYG